MKCLSCLRVETCFMDNFHVYLCNEFVFFTVLNKQENAEKQLSGFTFMEIARTKSQKNEKKKKCEDSLKRQNANKICIALN